ncbi:MAG: glutamate racemase [Dictyoglomus sp.]
MSKKIGILDSGVGGLSVLKEVYLKSLAEEVYFLGDTSYFPYGIKPVDFIQSRVSKIVRFFMDLGIEEIIIACNTASAVAYDYLVERYKDVKIYSIVLSAIEGMKNFNWRKVGVLATRRTLESKVYPKLVHERISEEVEVLVRSCSEGMLLETIERGIVDGELIEEELKKCTDPLIKEKIEGLILGCTHLPFVKQVISRLYPNMPIIDPSQEIIKLVNTGKEKNVKVHIFVTGEPQEFQYIVKDLLKVEWNVENVDLDRSDVSVIKR